ncbi:MAG: hypothetical protein M1582_01690, partial [Actinobacteria bacterium]|nr:hypothetical protein [Actinomycetota bacterium]
MLDSNKMLDNATWQQDLDTLFARISDHYVVDEEAFVAELINRLAEKGCRVPDTIITNVQIADWSSS